MNDGVPPTVIDLRRVCLPAPALEPRIIRQQIRVYIRLLLWQGEKQLTIRKRGSPYRLMPYKIIPVPRHIIVYFQRTEHVKPHLILKTQLETTLQPDLMLEIRLGQNPDRRQVGPGPDLVHIADRIAVRPALSPVTSLRIHKIYIL